MELCEFTLPILSPLGTILSLIPSDLPMSSDPSGMWRQTESVFERDSPPPLRYYFKKENNSLFWK